VAREQNPFTNKAFQAMEQMEQAEHDFFTKTKKNNLMPYVRTVSKSIFLRVLLVPFVPWKSGDGLKFNVRSNAVPVFRS
jgi:hypothetical protein